MTTELQHPGVGPLTNDASARLHQQWVLGLAIGACLLGLLLPPLSIAQQFWAVLIPIVIVGLSHGGADPTILRHLAQERKQGVVWAVSLYVAVALGFIAVIWWWPTLALLLFLALSVWHFGYTDAGFIHRRSTPALVWLSGSLTILGPMLGHPGQTAEMFSWLIGADPTPVQEVLRLIGPVLGVVWLTTLVRVAYRNWTDLSTLALIELVLLATAMIVLPPLLAFGFYFCVVHSLRHFMVLLALQKNGATTPISLGYLVRLTAPATGIAVVLALLAWGLMSVLEPGNSALMAAVKVMFWALAALTVPHAVAVNLWWRRPQL